MDVFRFGTEGILLFQSWRLSSTSVLVAACLVTFFLTAVYEGLKTFRVWLVTRPLRLLIKRGSQSPSPHSTSDALMETANKLNETVSQRRFLQLSTASTKNARNKIHVLQTVLHVIQVFVGYVSMLIVMTYDAWLGLAVVSGAGIGYFSFAAVFPDDLRIRGVGSQGFDLVDRKCETSLLPDQ